MNNTIVVAGGTGKLGEKIIRSLLAKGAEVRGLIRPGSDISKLEEFEKSGLKIIKADMSNIGELTEACKGASCIVSALQGLHDVIVDVQSNLMKAAIAAGVPRFIPSDYSTDFTKLPAGKNRNFDLRREFHKHLDVAAISATSIFNGAFAEILSYNIPVFDMKKKTIGYWGDNDDWKLDFTTMDNTAQFTAAAALDPSTPHILRIAGFQVSPKELLLIANELTNSEFTLVRMGSIEDFAAYNKRERAAHPEGENEIFPKWQNGQYMHDMFSTQHESLDNERYGGINWTKAQEFIGDIIRNSTNRND